MDYRYYVYVLKLESGKLYVGSTGVLYARMQQHFSGNGSVATKASRPTKAVQVYPCISREQAYTLEAYLQHEQKYTHGWTAPSVSCGADVQKLHLLAQDYRVKQLARREAYYEALRYPRRPKIQITRGPVRRIVREVAQQALERFIKSLVS